MRHTLRTAATVSDSPLQALDQLNRELDARSSMALCTAVCVVLRERDGQSYAEVVCAGHPLPLLIRDGEVAYAGRFGPMLGAYPDEQWVAVPVPVRAGDVLVLYTDGVLDTVGAHDRFGPDRLAHALTGASDAQDAVGRVDAALAAFQVGDQADDTAILAVQRAATPAAPENDPDAASPPIASHR